MMELSERHRAFVDEYMINGFNATKAYLKVYPDCSYNSAQTSSSDLLLNPMVKSEIEFRKEEIRIKEEIQLSFLVDELKDIINSAKADEKADRNSILRALDQLAKLGGLYTQNIKTEITGGMPPEIKINIVKPKDGN